MGFEWSVVEGLMLQWFRISDFNFFQNTHFMDFRFQKLFTQFPAKNLKGHITSYDLEGFGVGLKRSSAVGASTSKVVPYCRRWDFRSKNFSVWEICRSDHSLRKSEWICVWITKTIWCACGIECGFIWTEKTQTQPFIFERNLSGQLRRLVSRFEWLLGCAIKLNYVEESDCVGQP
jgi:hypothetical protein